MRGLGKSSQSSSTCGNSEGSFPGKEVALELRSFIWKDEGGIRDVVLG